MSEPERESEIKLAAPVDFTLPPLDDAANGLVAGLPNVVHLDATYYDTGDLRLTRSGASLRYREGAWTVKLPAKGDESMVVRDEHRFEGPPDAPPADALDLVRALVRDAAVAPVATLRTERRRVPVRSADGQQVAEVADDEVDVVRDGAPVDSFREIEIELTPAATDRDRSAIVGRLRGTGAGSPDPTPKIVRALGPLAKAPPDVEEVRVGSPARIEEVLRAALSASVRRLIAHDPGIRLDGDPEDVHQARVATRRLRSYLRTFRPLVDEHWANELRDELRWLGGALGAVRDADVLLERLEGEIDRIPEADQVPARVLLARLRETRDEARVSLLDAVRSDRYVALLDRLVQAAQRPLLLLGVDDHDDEDALRDLVRQPWQHLRTAVAALPDDPPDASLHEVRIRTKRARYSAEAVEPAFGKPARALARALTDVQDVLGEHQDAVVAANWLRGEATRAGAGELAVAAGDAELTFAAGELAALERVAAERARAEWPDAWRAADRKRTRGWL